MTKLTEIREAIRDLPAKEQDVLRVWMDEAPLDLERDTPELETELLKAVRGPHRDLTKSELETIAERAKREHRNQRTA